MTTRHELKRWILLVLAWLSVIDITAALVSLALDASGMQPLPWTSVTCTVTTLVVYFLTGATGDEWAVRVQVAIGIALGLLVPWKLFQLAARERRRAAAPPSTAT